MIEKQQQALHVWFGDQIRACKENQEKLYLDERTDEANFEKIRANVYDIFRTILSVAVENGKGDREAVKRFFMEKTEKIPANWIAAYDKANQHGDEEQMQIETIKLDTVQEIKQKFLAVWEVSE